MTEELKLPDHRHFKWLTIATVVALVIGFVLGLLAHGNPSPDAETFYLVMKPLEQGWMLAIRLVVIPLMFLYIVVAIAGRERESAGTGVFKSAALIHLALLLSTLAIILLVVPLTLGLFEITPEIEAAFQAGLEAGAEEYPFPIAPG